MLHLLYVPINPGLSESPHFNHFGGWVAVFHGVANCMSLAILLEALLCSLPHSEPLVEMQAEPIPDLSWRLRRNLEGRKQAAR